MERDYYFDSADEALNFCQNLLKTGAADLFRGQNKDWPTITPSLFRGDAVAREKATTVLAQFIEWANAVPQMARYWGWHQQITAIAQHYGIPTPYLDLTTDPETAAIFAAVPEDSGLAGRAVIYCFKRNELETLSGFALHELDVANLWRLKSQKGLFLEVLEESDVERLRACAIRIHFPARCIREEESRIIYPPRKSALEIVIDQWIYRHMIAKIISGLADTPHQLMIKRYTYPGVARWRTIPEFDPEWVDWEPGWVLQDDNEVISPGQDNKQRINIPRGRTIHETLEHLENEISVIVDRYRLDQRSFDFELTIDGYLAESLMATVLFNRCWDGLRVHPYPVKSMVRSLAVTAVAILWRLDHPSTDWEKALWGETESIDVAPVGGHLDSGAVSSRSLMEAFHDKYHGALTEHARRSASLNPLFLTNYVVDPWMLFDFRKLSQMFVEEFIPSCLGWYWKSCLEDEDRKLGDLWAISFNPALLGFVTLSSYRFNSPIATEIDVERVILISSNMNEQDIEEIFISCLPAILSGGKPFTIKFTDYGFDSREIWEIEEVIQQCKMIIKIGGISVLDVIPGIVDQDEPEETSPRNFWESKGLGALHIWAIANGRLQEINGVPFDQLQDLFKIFWNELLESNVKIEALARNQPDWPGPI